MPEGTSGTCQKDRVTPCLQSPHKKWNFPTPDRISQPGLWSCIFLVNKHFYFCCHTFKPQAIIPNHHWWPRKDRHTSSCFHFGDHQTWRSHHQQYQTPDKWMGRLNICIAHKSFGSKTRNKWHKHNGSTDAPFSTFYGFFFSGCTCTCDQRKMSILQWYRHKLMHTRFGLKHSLRTETDLATFKTTSVLFMARINPSFGRKKERFSCL